MADAAAELEEGGMVRTLKDLFAGAAGGIAQVLLGEFIFDLSASECSFAHPIAFFLACIFDITCIQKWGCLQISDIDFKYCQIHYLSCESFISSY